MRAASAPISLTHFGIPGGVLVAACALAACASDDRGGETVARVRQKTTDDGVAEAEYGQPDFSTSVAQPPPSGLLSPRGVTVDPMSGSHRIHVADSGYNRTFSLLQDTLDAPGDLFGQGTLSGSSPNGGGSVSGYVTDDPHDVAHYQDLWLLADTGNNRVLLGYADPTAGATNVFGQQSRLDTNGRNQGGIGPGSLAAPTGVAILSGNRGFVVSDSGNHRVLVFGTASNSAIGVVGQSDFVSSSPNHGLSPSAIGLNDPRGVSRASLYADQFSLDGTLRIPPDPRVDGFYVADRGNNRVLHFKWCTPSVTLPPVPCPDADVVYGQPTFEASGANVGADGLNAPTGVAIDPNGGLWVADTGNNRVLHFSFGKTVADRVLGQPDFTTGDPPTVVSERTLTAPEGVAVAPNGDLYVADTGANRIVRYAFVPTSADQCDDGDPCTDDSLGATCVHDFHQATRTPGGRSISVVAACQPYVCDLTTRQCLDSCFPDGVCYTTFFCAGGKCVSTCGAGECASGFCVDGFCCDAECSGTCEACNVFGHEGTCTPIPNGPPSTFRPLGKCSSAVDSQECAGQCDGFRRDACTPTFKGTTCGAIYCKDGVGARGGKCDGAGACVLDALECFPFACGAGECRTACVANDECASGAECVSGVCVASSVAVAPVGGSCAVSARRFTRADRWVLGAFASLAFLACAARRRRNAS